MEDGMYNMCKIFGSIDEACRRYDMMYRVTGLSSKGVGTGAIVRFIEKYGVEFYVIKADRYYGFFLDRGDRRYVCNFGRIDSAAGTTDINNMHKNFAHMIEAYKEYTDTYIIRQKEIADFVRKAGGTGEIEGCSVGLTEHSSIYVAMNGLIAYRYRKKGMECRVYRKIKELALKDREVSKLNWNVHIGESKARRCLKAGNIYNWKSMEYIVHATDGLFSIDDDNKLVSGVKELEQTGILRMWNTDILRWWCLKKKIETEF